MNRYAKLIIICLLALGVASIAAWPLNFYQADDCYDYAYGPGSCLIQDSNVRLTVESMVAGVAVFGICVLIDCIGLYVRNFFLKEKGGVRSPKSFSNAAYMTLGSYVIASAFLLVLTVENSSLAILVYALEIMVVLIAPVTMGVIMVRSCKNNK